MKKNTLYIGRFQPFHKGHADAILQILENLDLFVHNNIFIGIGSAETNFTQSNPLTAGERFEIISDACDEILENFLQSKNISSLLDTQKIRFHIVPIRNIDHYALWPHHVQQYFPEIHNFYSGSPLVLQLWKNSFPKLSDANIFEITKRKDVSGTKVRGLLLKNIDNNLEESLGKYLLSSTINLLEKFDLSKRLQNMKTY